MKVKEYIEAFSLNVETRINSTKLKETLERDFDSLIENNNGSVNINDFNACVNKIIQKIDAINLRAKTEIHEGFVRFFYATVVLERKRQYFPEIMEKNEKEYQQRKKTFEHGTK